MGRSDETSIVLDADHDAFLFLLFYCCSPSFLLTVTSPVQDKVFGALSLSLFLSRPPSCSEREGLDRSYIFNTKVGRNGNGSLARVFVRHFPYCPIINFWFASPPTFGSVAVAVTIAEAETTKSLSPSPFIHKQTNR